MRTVQPWTIPILNPKNPFHHLHAGGRPTIALSPRSGGIGQTFFGQTKFNLEPFDPDVLRNQQSPRVPLRGRMGTAMGFRRLTIAKLDERATFTVTARRGTSLAHARR